MTPEETVHYREQARVIKALAHPSRILIVDQLALGQKCVCELRDCVGADLSTVSKHLAVMKRAGIVTDERRGVKIYYRLKVPCILNFFHCVKAVLEDRGRS